MIDMVQSLPAGNALRVFVTPPAGASRVRLLRKAADTFTDPFDAGAFSVADDSDLHAVLDTTALVNGQTYYYRDYALVGAVWQTGLSVTGIPATTYVDVGSDPLSIVRDRLEAGLKAEVAAGRLNHENGKIPVLTAPPTFEDTRWPVVTVHLAGDNSEIRALGEEVAADLYDNQALDWNEYEGWLSRVTLTVIGWSLNADERITLRRAIKRILQANLPVFDEAGMVQIDFSQQDTEDFERYSAPVYQVVGTLSCLAPSVVSAPEPAITDVTVTATVPAAP